MEELSNQQKKQLIAQLEQRMRVALEEQVQNADPPEAKFVFDTLSKNGDNIEDIYRSMGFVAAKFLAPLLYGDGSFDLASYKKALLELVDDK